MIRALSAIQAVLSLSATTATNLTELFGPSLSKGARIVLPTDASWVDEIQARWTDYQAPSYLGAIKPATEEDVQAIVTIAAANDIPFFTTGGGHGTSDWSSFEGISIDLGFFKSTEMVHDNQSITIGGATEYSQVGAALYEVGKELPLASCACPGVVGATMGAGVGVLMGHRGLMLDALESVRLVTADGKLVTASSTQNPELFWAVRGGGPNWGIITSATYQVYDITNHGLVSIYDMVFSASSNKSFFETLHTFDQSLPSRMALTNLGYYDRKNDQALILVHAVYFGPEKEGEAILEPFKRVGPTSFSVRTIEQNTLFPPVFGSCDPNQHINMHSVAVKQIDPSALETVYNTLDSLWRQHPGFQGRLLIQRFPNDAVVAVNDENTAYPWRDAIAYINLESFMTNTGIYGLVDKFAQKARSLIDETSGYDTLATYSNYARGDEDPTAWYSARKLQRLSAVKRKWDPKQLFSWSRPVPMHWGEEMIEL